MSWIIRLQNLPWSANSMDIRIFFNGLSIPDGGVHIVGGEMGDAFIAFSTDEDARQAMAMDGAKLKEVGVRLLLSSRAEMQKVIETARQQTMSVFQLNTAPVVAAPAPLVPNPQLLLTQQFLQQQQQQQQQQQLPMFANTAVAEFAAQQMMTSVPPPVVVVADKSRSSIDKKASAGGRDRRRDSRSNSRDRYSRDRSRSRDRSPSRPSRRNRSRSRSREKSSYNRRRRVKRSYSRERDSDRSRDSDSQGSLKKSNSPPKPKAEPINPWSTNVFQSVNTNNGRGALNNGGQNNFNNIQASGMDGNMPPFSSNSRFNANGNSRQQQPCAPDPPKMDNNSFVAFQRLREKRNESAFQSSNPSGQHEDTNTSIDLTEDDHNCCVKLSNIEPTTGYGEIRRFLQGLPVQQNGLKMINDDNGRRTGVAYVQFLRPESRKFALMRTGQVLNGNKIVVNTLDDREFDEAIDAYRPPLGSRRPINNSTQPLAFDQLEFTCLKVTDVPTLTTEQDIMKIFSDYGLMHIIISKDKQKRNCAYLKLNRSEDAKRALREKNNFHMGHKSIITVTMCSEVVFDEVMNANAVEETSGYGSQEDMGHDDQRDMDNSPNKSNKANEKRASNSRWGEKVLNLPPIPAGVLEQEAALAAARKTNSRWTNPPMAEESGIAPNPILSQLNLPLSLLSSLLPQAAAAAATAVQEKINPVDPRLHQAAAVSRDPRLKNMGNVSSHSYPARMAAPQPQLSLTGPMFRNGNRDEESDCVVVSNLEASRTDLDVAAFFSRIGAVPKRVHILLNTTGSPSGDAFVEFPNSSDATKALQLHEQTLGNHKVYVETIPREQVDEVLASFGNGGVRKPPAASSNPQFPAGAYNAGPLDPRTQARQASLMARPGMMPNQVGPMRPTETNVLALNNVPYKAGVDDIIGFFSGYNIRPQDIMRRFNDAGQPTAEAKVRFKDPEEARKALEDNKYMKMLGRTIYLEFDQ